MTIDNLEKELKLGQLHSLYLLYGEELYLLESNLKRIKNLFGECIKGINFIMIDEQNVSEIISDIETPSFGYEKKLIIARNTGLFKKEGKRKTGDTTKIKDKLSKYIEENMEIIDESVVLVFVEEEADIKSALYSAINKNVEMMLWLGTKNMYLNGDKFLEDIFCGPVGDAKNPFEQVTVADAVLETESDNRNLLEQKIKDLCRVKRQAVISEDNENAGKYKIEVEFSGIESDSEVTVSPFNSKQEQTLSEHIEFSELEILQLSEFYEITVRSGDDTIRRIIMIPTSGFPDDRESAAVNSVVKDRASFVEYIAFVLGDDYVASMLEGKQMGESGFFANSSDAMPALYEKMLKTSVEGPERIKDIGYVLKMVTDKDIIPDEFRELYETFCNTLKIRR